MQSYKKKPQRKKGTRGNGIQSVIDQKTENRVNKPPVYQKKESSIYQKPYQLMPRKTKTATPVKEVEKTSEPEILSHLSPRGVENLKRVTNEQDRITIMNYLPDMSSNIRLINNMNNPHKLLQPDKILKEYDELQDKELEELTDLYLSWTSASPRSVEDIAVILKYRPDAPRILGRVQAGNYPTLGRNQAFIWVTDPQDIIGLSIKQIGERIGWTEQYLKDTMKYNNGKIWVDLIEPPKNVILKKVDWNTIKSETLKIIQTGNSTDVDSHKDLLIDLSQIPSLKLHDGTVNTETVKKYFDILSRTEVEGINNLPADIQLMRDAVEAVFGTNPLFTGKGYTVNNSFEIGTSEYGLSQTDSAFNIEKMRSEGYIIKRLELNIDGTVKFT